MKKFNIGEVVKLTSDSNNQTPMTVVGYLEDIYSEAYSFGLLPKGMVRCVWRDISSVPFEKDYPEDCLVKM